MPYSDSPRAPLPVNVETHLYLTFDAITSRLAWILRRNRVHRETLGVDIDYLGVEGFFVGECNAKCTD